MNDEINNKYVRHWPESSGQSPQRCQCLEVLPIALPPKKFLLRITSEKCKKFF